MERLPLALFEGLHCSGIQRKGCGWQELCGGSEARPLISDAEAGPQQFLCVGPVPRLDPSQEPLPHIPPRLHRWSPGCSLLEATKFPPGAGGAQEPPPTVLPSLELGGAGSRLGQGRATVTLAPLAPVWGARSPPALGHLSPSRPKEPGPGGGGYRELDPLPALAAGPRAPSQGRQWAGAGSPCTCRPHLPGCVGWPHTPVP